MSEDNLAFIQARAVGLSSGTLGLNILPTEKCNFRCVYCYENFPNIRMLPSVAQSVKKLLHKRSGDLTNLSIGWFGGEPLLEPATVIDISSYALELSNTHNFSYVSHITTNGYFLDKDLFDRLVDSGIVKFQITLDGTEEYHNKTRRSMNGAGNFNRIFNNLLSIKESEKAFIITLRLHIHKNNVEDVKSLISMLCDSFGGDNRFVLALQYIKKYGSDHEFNLELADENAKKELGEYLTSKIGPQQIRNPLAALQCCYASLPNHFVVRSNGKLQKCTIALYDERNDVGELRSDGTISLYDRDRLQMWSAGIFDGDALKLKCPWIGIRENKG